MFVRWLIYSFTFRLKFRWHMDSSRYCVTSHRSNFLLSILKLKARFLSIRINLMKGDRATGFGVALLNSLFGDSIKNPVFKSIGCIKELPLKNGSETQDEE